MRTRHFLVAIVVGWLGGTAQAQVPAAYQPTRPGQVVGYGSSALSAESGTPAVSESPSSGFSPAPWPTPSRVSSAAGSMPATVTATASSVPPTVAPSSASSSRPAAPWSNSITATSSSTIADRPSAVSAESSDPMVQPATYRAPEPAVRERVYSEPMARIAMPRSSPPPAAPMADGTPDPDGPPLTGPAPSAVSPPASRGSPGPQPAAGPIFYEERPPAITSTPVSGPSITSTPAGPMLSPSGSAVPTGRLTPVPGSSLPISRSQSAAPPARPAGPMPAPTRYMPMAQAMPPGQGAVPGGNVPPAESAAQPTAYFMPYGDPGIGLGLQGGVGWTLVKPRWSSNPAYVTAILDGGTVIQGQTSFAYDYEWSPLIWVGVFLGDGLGVRMRWWMFDQNTSDTFTVADDAIVLSAAPLGEAVFAGPGEAFSISSGLDLDVWDVELTQPLVLGLWEMLVSGGFRYAHLSQNFLAVSEDDEGSSTSSGHNFNGAGPTLALDARRMIGDSGLGLYCTTRGSLLWGKARQAVVEIEADEVEAFNFLSEDALLPVCEIEAGIQYSVPLGLAQFFLQTGVVAQVWFGAGNAANNGYLPDSFGPGDPLDSDANLGFFGWTASAGLRY